jgi:hypothetical protein
VSTSRRDLITFAIVIIVAVVIGAWGVTLTPGGGGVDALALDSPPP